MRDADLVPEVDFASDVDLLREGEFARAVDLAREGDFVLEGDLVGEGDLAAEGDLVPEGERPRLLARSRVPRSLETDICSSSSLPAHRGELRCRLDPRLPKL